jgi:hypothetical protein
MFRDYVVQQPDVTVTNLVWRASYSQGDWIVAVNTHTLHWRSGTLGFVDSMVQWLMRQESGEELVRGLKWGSETYGWRLERQWVDHEALTYNIWACGWAFTKAAAKVVGRTSSGRVVEGPVVNGFWFLYLPVGHAPEVLETVSVQDSQGKVVHTYQ